MGSGEGVGGLLAPFVGNWVVKWFKIIIGGGWFKRNHGGVPGHPPTPMPIVPEPRLESRSNSRSDSRSTSGSQNAAARPEKRPREGNVFDEIPESPRRNPLERMVARVRMRLMEEDFDREERRVMEEEEAEMEEMEEVEEDDEEPMHSDYNLRVGICPFYGFPGDDVAVDDRVTDPDFDPMAFARKEREENGSDAGYDSMGSDDLDALEVPIGEEEMVVTQTKTDFDDFIKAFPDDTVLDTVLRLKSVELSESVGRGNCTCTSTAVMYCYDCHTISSCKACWDKGGCVTCGTERDAEKLECKMENTGSLREYIGSLTPENVKREAERLNTRLDDFLGFFNGVRDKVSFIHMLYDRCNKYSSYLTPSRGMCTICYKSATTLFMPCGHFSICDDCFHKISYQDRNKCHMCRSNVDLCEIPRVTFISGVHDHDEVSWSFRKVLNVETMLDYNMPEDHKRVIVEKVTKKNSSVIEIVSD